MASHPKIYVSANDYYYSEIYKLGNSLFVKGMSSHDCETKLRQIAEAMNAIGVVGFRSIQIYGSINNYTCTGSILLRKKGIIETICAKLSQ